jgi:hypothetical protein
LTAAETAHSGCAGRIDQPKKQLSEKQVPSVQSVAAGAPGVVGDGRWELSAVSGWIGVTTLPTKLTGGSGNPSRDFTKPILEIPRTVVIIKTKTGVICGGFHHAAWCLDVKYSKDPGRLSFIFALVNSKLPVPIRFGFVGSADANIRNRTLDFRLSR